MPREENISDDARLDRIERHIAKLTEASSALQQELKIARALAAARANAVRSIAPKMRRKPTKARRSPKGK
jgi:hypothetical protein